MEKLVSVIGKLKETMEDKYLPIVKAVPIDKKDSQPNVIRARIVHDTQKPDFSIYKNDEIDDHMQKICECNKKTYPDVLYLNNAISKVSNKIRDYLKNQNIYEKINATKLTAEIFYLKLGNSIYHSLTQFCEIKFDENKNIVSLPNIEDARFPKRKIPVLVFFDRIWQNDKIKSQKTPEDMMNLYRNEYNDYDGLLVNQGWENIFAQILKSKIPFIDEEDITLISNVILVLWGSRTGKEPAKLILDPNIQGMTLHPIEWGNDDECEIEVDEETEEDENEEEEEDEEDEEDLYTRVEIHIQEDLNTIIRIRYCGDIGEISIPFYVNLEELDNVENHYGDGINGNWDWLIHTIPDRLIHTSNPARYLEGNNIPIEECYIRFAVIDKVNGEDGELVYLVGCYIFDGIYIIDAEGEKELDEGDDLLAKINYLVQTQIRGTSISHFLYSLNNMKDLIETEDDIEEADETSNLRIDNTMVAETIMKNMVETETHPIVDEKDDIVEESNDETITFDVNEFEEYVEEEIGIPSEIYNDPAVISTEEPEDEPFMFTPITKRPNKNVD